MTDHALTDTLATLAALDARAAGREALSRAEAERAAAMLRSLRAQLESANAGYLRACSERNALRGALLEAKNLITGTAYPDLSAVSEAICRGLRGGAL